ncbi:MAG: zinc protease, partial [Proteobacteria bacterium]|nr:zinc protease [Pseudomonadota bacterium]
MFVNNPVARKTQRLLLGATLLLVSFAAFATPKIEHWTLKNGARVYFVEAHNLPMVTLNVVFDAGSARDPQGRNGLSMLTNHLLDNGTGELDADAIA